MRCHPDNQELIREIERQGINRPFQRGSRIKAKWGLARYPLKIASGEQAKAIRGVQDMFAAEIDEYTKSAKCGQEHMERDEELSYLLSRVERLDDIITNYVETAEDERGSDRTKKPRIREEAGGPDENCGTSIIGYGDDGEYVMLLDNREITKRNEFSKMLESNRWCVPCQLPIGDMVWAYRCSQITMNRRSGKVTPLTKYYLTGLIIERKTYRDLGSSIVDERYKAQIQRLSAFSHDPGTLNLPLKDMKGRIRKLNPLVIVLIEQSSQQIDPTVVNIKAVETAIVKFQCRDKFLVLHTNSNQHSSDLLELINSRIQPQIEQTLSQESTSIHFENEFFKDAPPSESAVPISHAGGRRLSLGTSATLYSKCSGLTSYDLFRKQLRLIPNVQPNDADYLLANFPTYFRLVGAM